MRPASVLARIKFAPSASSVHACAACGTTHTSPADWARQLACTSSGRVAGQAGSLAGEVLQLAARRTSAQAPPLRLVHGRRVPLDGAELQAWEAQQHASLLQPLDADVDLEPAPENVTAVPLQSR